MRRTTAATLIGVILVGTLPVDCSHAQTISKVKQSSAAWGPTRDSQPIVAAINREWQLALEQQRLKSSPRCDDAKFVRRAALDLTGRIPTLPQTLSFLDDERPDKRLAFVDMLLGSRSYAEHLARCWKRLIQPPDLTSTKSSVDRFTPWLADQFAAGRPWSDLVRELLTVEVDLSREPRGAFFAANSEQAVPQPKLLAASVGRVFLGVQIGCAECHQHPFSEWTQDDFWGLAAYFSRTRKVSKGDFTLTEASSDGTSWSTASITIPDGSGKASGKVVPARLLGGGQPSRIADPLRPQLAEWLTADTNPYFARAMVNRLWAHCMGRGLIEPLDDQREGNEPTHPALLQLLADEFVASGYDVRHILRCIVLSEPYQVDAQPTPENTADRSYDSHRLARAMVPDVLYDSLGVAMNPILIRPSSPSGKPPGKPTDKFSGSIQLEPRDKFIRFFGRAALDDTREVFSYGIPQLLRLMNGRELNQPLGFLTGLIKNESDPRLRIDTLYLIALLRLVGDDTESIDGYGSVWWVLLNSSEFMIHD